VQTDQLSATFAALADPTRRAILARLAQGETTVKDLAEPFEMTPSAVTKHLQVLRRAVNHTGTQGAVAAMPSGGGPAEGRCGLDGDLPSLLGRGLRSSQRASQRVTTRRGSTQINDRIAEPAEERSS
jgi:DNA-binding transcriptional ArsR family regulator